MSSASRPVRRALTSSNLEAEHSLFKRTLDTLPDGVLLTGSVSQVIYANPAFASIWRIPPGLLQTRDRISLREAVASQLADPDEFYREQERLHLSMESSDGEISFKDGRIISRRSVPFIEGEEIRARIWIFCDVTEARSASIDSLTGLRNRRAYSREFPQYVQAPEDGFVRAIAIMDVDNFKAFNDIYGHAAGDAVLRQIGTILRSHLASPDDLAFRIGGEEFLIACHSRSDADAVSFLKDLQRSIAATAIPHAGNLPHGIVTASFGVGVFRGPQNPAVLFQKVDTALYEAKTVGRNRVTLAALS